MKYDIVVSKVMGTVTQTETATITVNADTVEGAKRMAIEQLADDASDVKWSAVPTSSTVTIANASAHIVSVTAESLTPTTAAAAH